VQLQTRLLKLINLLRQNGGQLTVNGELRQDRVDASMAELARREDQEAERMEEVMEQLRTSPKEFFTPQEVEELLERAAAATSPEEQPASDEEVLVETQQPTVMDLGGYLQLSQPELPSPQPSAPNSPPSGRQKRAPISPAPRSRAPRPPAKSPQPRPPKMARLSTTPSPTAPSTIKTRSLPPTALEERREMRERFERSQAATLAASPAPRVPHPPSQLFLDSFPGCSIETGSIQPDTP
jgi:hypothetical protein